MLGNNIWADLRTGVTLNVHLFEAGVPPSIRVLLLDVQQLFVPVVAAVRSRLLHHTVDLLASSHGQTGIWKGRVTELW